MGGCLRATQGPLKGDMAARLAAALGLMMAVWLTSHGAEAQRKGTLQEDMRAMHALWRAWGHPQSLQQVWMSGDPCGVEQGAGGITCGVLEEPVSYADGSHAWFYVKWIQVTSKNAFKVNYNVSGSILPEAFANGSLAHLEILDLSFNSLEGPIPSEISNLRNLTRLALNNNQLSGTIPAALSRLSGLDILWLGSNKLTGTVPSELGALAPSLKSFKAERNQLYQGVPTFLDGFAEMIQIDLSYNLLSLSIPAGLAQLTNLTGLFLQSNYLTGTIPAAFGDFKSLSTLKLNNNKLTGSIPIEITRVTTLRQLILNDNQLTGTIPAALASMPSLLVLSLQANNFTGAVGPAFNKFPQGFLFNTKLCNDLDGSGYQPCSCTSGQVGKQLCNNVTGPGPCICPAGTLPEGAEEGLPVVWTVVIAVGGGLIFVLLIGLLWWGWRTSFGRKNAGGWEYAGKIRSFPDVQAYRSQAYDPDEIDGYGVSSYDPAPHGGSGHGGAVALDGAQTSNGGPAASTPLTSGSSTATAAAFARKFGRSLNSQLTMRQFSLDELQLATNNFSPDNIASADGTRKTYSGVLPSGTYIAVKELDVAASESVEAFAAAVEVFSLVRCPQLVEVLGFSCARNGNSHGRANGSRLLVCELMPNGSLDLHLHDLDPSSPPLGWHMRMSIALQAAKGLAYLHSMSPQMVHQHLHARNVLLDDMYNAKLSDYCLDSLCPRNGGSLTHSSINVAVAAGTAAPELAWSSQPTPRTDVYAFGVLLLELVTGRRPIDSARPPTEQSLVRWVKPRLTERAQVEAMVDGKLRGSFSSAALYQVALLASQCIQTDPEARPPMAQAVDVLQNVQGLPIDTNGSRFSM